MINEGDVFSFGKILHVVVRKTWLAGETAFELLCLEGVLAGTLTLTFESRLTSGEHWKRVT